MKFINLDELDAKIKSLDKPTPYDVLEIITKMKEKLQ